MFDLSFLCPENKPLIQKASQSLRRWIRQHTESGAGYTNLYYLSAYLLSRVSEEGLWDCPYKALVEENCFSLEEDLADWMQHPPFEPGPILSEENWKALLTQFAPQTQFDSRVYQALCLYEADVFDEYSLRDPSDMSPFPLEIDQDISLRLLQIGKGDKVLDVFGRGSDFLFHAALSYPDAAYTGLCYESGDKPVARIRSKILDLPLKLETMEDWPSLLPRQTAEKYDKIYYGIRRTFYTAGSARSRELLSACKQLPSHVSGGWAFVSSVLDQMKIGGRAVMLLSESAAINRTDQDARRYFLEKGQIESVVFLPDRFMSMSSRSLCLLVLRKEKQEKPRPVRLADLTPLFKKERTGRSLEREKLEKAVDAVQEDVKGLSHSYELEELDKQEDSFWPARYISDERAIPKDYALRLQDVTVKMTRGTHASAGELDALYQEKETSAKLITWSDLKDGYVSHDLTSLKDPLPAKYEKYCVKPMDLLISKNGFPVRTAVVDDYFEDRQVLVSGNLYILSLDQERINPYYLQAYLESEFGQRALLRVMGGSAIKNISIDSLRSLMIPCPPLEEQMSTARRMRSTIKTMRANERENEALREEMAHQIYVPDET